jgi:hypothetical protein
MDAISWTYVVSALRRTVTVRQKPDYEITVRLKPDTTYLTLPTS